jgi:cytochrome c
MTGSYPTIHKAALDIMGRVTIVARMDQRGGLAECAMTRLRHDKPAGVHSMSRSVRPLAVSVLILTATAAGPSRAQDTGAGEAIFKTHCQACHTAGPGGAPGVGPNLSGLVGRKAASTSFSYSDALKASGLTWDRKTLDAFLAAPSQLVPGTRMVISVPDAKQRADLIAYLAALKR